MVIFVYYKPEFVFCLVLCTSFTILEVAVRQKSNATRVHHAQFTYYLSTLSLKPMITTPEQCLDNTVHVVINLCAPFSCLYPMDIGHYEY